MKHLKPEPSYTSPRTTGKQFPKLLSFLIFVAAIAALALILWHMESCIISHTSTLQLQPSRDVTDSIKQQKKP